MKIIYLVYITLIVFRHHVFANETTSSTTEQTTTKKYHLTDRIVMCSRWLSSVISNFCDNVYKIVKRDTSLMIDKLAPSSLQQQKNRELLLLEESWRRVRRQIVSECCEKSCSIADVISYCPDDALVLKINPDLFDY